MTTTTLRIVTSVAAFGVVAGIAASATRGYGQTGKSGGDSGGSRTVHVVVKNADQTTRTNTSSGEISSMIGHVLVVSDDTTMVSDKVAYNEKTGVANSPGAIKIDDPQNTVKGDTGTAFYARRDAVIVGNVHITVRPKPSDANAPEGSSRREFKNPVNITCDKTVYNWRTRVAVLTGHLTMKEEKTLRTVTAEKGTYYGKDEKVVLEGNVHYTRPNGDIGDTPLATAILTEGHESFSTAALKGIFNVPAEEEDSATTVTARPTPGTPTPGTPGTPASPTAPGSAPADGTGTPAAAPINPPTGAPATTPPAAPTSPAPNAPAPAVPAGTPSTSPKSGTGQ